MPEEGGPIVKKVRHRDIRSNPQVILKYLTVEYLE